MPAAGVKLKIGEGWFVLEKDGKTYLGPTVVEDDEPEETEEEEAAAGDVAEGDQEPPQEPQEPQEYTLCPCYVVRYAMSEDPRTKQPGMAVLCEPYFFLGHHTPVTIVDPSIVLDLGDVHEDDRGIFVQCVKMAETSRMQSRMMRSGIVAPTATGR